MFGFRDILMVLNHWLIMLPMIGTVALVLNLVLFVFLPFFYILKINTLLYWLEDVIIDKFNKWLIRDDCYIMCGWQL